MYECQNKIFIQSIIFYEIKSYIALYFYEDIKKYYKLLTRIGGPGTCLLTEIIFSENLSQ